MIMMSLQASFYVNETMKVLWFNVCDFEGHYVSVQSCMEGFEAEKVLTKSTIGLEEKESSRRASDPHQINH